MDDFIFDLRLIAFDEAAVRKAQSLGATEEWPEAEPFQLAQQALANVESSATETTSCSPVIPSAQLRRIRDNVVTQFNYLRNSYSNVGSSLDSRGLMTQCRAVFDAMEGGQYCYYQTDQGLIDDIKNCGNGANNLLANAFAQYANTFGARLAPMRSAYNSLTQAANSATNNVDPTLTAYKSFWAANFTWNLHTGINGGLDGLINEYNRLTTGSEQLFTQGTNRVQGNFEAEVRNNNNLMGVFARAYETWNTQDGDNGYAAFADNIPAFQNSLSLISNFRVLDNPKNQQIFAEIQSNIASVRQRWQAFPNFPPAVASAGFVLDLQGTSSRKFFARQKTLNIAQAAGAHYTSVIAPGQSLIGTGFSYQHGGKMPPHAEHKDGKDCDIFSVYFRLGDPQYNERRAIDMAKYLLASGVTRLIYTNPSVVSAANAAVPGNAVAVVGSKHETHMHFDVES